MSVDNLIMVSAPMYAEFCADTDSRIGEQFGGTGIHSCGNFGRWIPAVKKIPNLLIVDGAFSPETDPAYNQREDFRDALAGTAIIVHARMVGDAQEVVSRVKRLRRLGMNFMVGTHVRGPEAQNRHYSEIHPISS